TRCYRDWSSDVCSSDLKHGPQPCSCCLGLLRITPTQDSEQYSAPPSRKWNGQDERLFGFLLAWKSPARPRLIAGGTGDQSEAFEIGRASCRERRMIAGR